MNIHSNMRRFCMAKPNKREEIIRAARELIAEHGFHGAPMAMIAERAGVGSGTIYRYFDNKDVLIAELYRELEDRIYLFVTEGYGWDRPARERFLHLGKSLLRFFIGNPLDFRYIEQFHNSPYGASIRRDKILGERRERDVFRELFEDGVSQQIIKELPLPVLYALALGPLVRVARDHDLGFVLLDEPLIGRVVEACWDGVKR
jgi:AcrR family transcriptional regulator